jgi:hypothetical protein
MSCFIFGDCLALGLAAVLGGCASDAKVGISSAAVQTTRKIHVCREISNRSGQKSTLDASFGCAQ